MLTNGHTTKDPEGTVSTWWYACEGCGESCNPVAGEHDEGLWPGEDDTDIPMMMG